MKRERFIIYDSLYYSPMSSLSPPTYYFYDKIGGKRISIKISRKTFEKIKYSGWTPSPTLISAEKIENSEVYSKIRILKTGNEVKEEYMEYFI